MSAKAGTPDGRTIPVRSAGSGDRTSGPPPTATRALLTCGALAGPLYVAVGAIETFTRIGYDFRRHPLSILSNGDWGWVHSTMMVCTGLLTVAGALGLRRALPVGRGTVWGPRLIGLYGLGVLAGGIFHADPALGFPPGTPVDVNAVSVPGVLHFVCGGIGFLGLIAGCIVFARRFAAQGQRGWAIYSAATGLFFFAAFFGIAAGSQFGGAVLTFVLLAFTAAIVLGWSWITAIMSKLIAGLSEVRA